MRLIGRAGDGHVTPPGKNGEGVANVHKARAKAFGVEAGKEDEVLGGRGGNERLDAVRHLFGVVLQSMAPLWLVAITHVADHWMAFFENGWSLGFPIMRE